MRPACTTEPKCSYPGGLERKAGKDTERDSIVPGKQAEREGKERKKGRDHSEGRWPKSRQGKKYFWA